MTHSWPTLTTPRTRLRALADGDQAFVLAHFGDPDVGRYLVDAEPPASLKEAQGIIEWSRARPEEPTQNRWAIVLASEDRPIGTCGFHKWDRRNRIAELGFDLASPHWRQGLMAEVLPVVIEYGFTGMGLNRIEAFVHHENEACRGLLQKLGFCHEGRLRARFLGRGRYHDHDLFSRLRSDPPHG